MSEKQRKSWLDAVKLVYDGDPLVDIFARTVETGAIVWLFTQVKERLSPTQFSEWLNCVKEELEFNEEPIAKELRLLPEQVEILKVVRDAASTMTALDISAKIHRTRKTVGEHLKGLVRGMLVSYPLGLRKGVSITEDGLALLDNRT